MELTTKLGLYSSDNPPLMNENEGYIKKMAQNVEKIDWRRAKQRIKSSLELFADFAEKAGVEDEILAVINKTLHTRFKSIKDILDLKILEAPMMEVGPDTWVDIKDDLYHKLIKLDFNSIFMSINKMLTQHGITNPSATVFYTLLWVVIETGKLGRK